jgi:hypothetical protein
MGPQASSHVPTEAPYNRIKTVTITLQTDYILECIWLLDYLTEDDKRQLDGCKKYLCHDVHK